MPKFIKNLAIIGAIALLLVFGISSIGSAGIPGYLSGIVINDQGIGIGGATVTVVGAGSTSTMESGFYLIVVPSGTWTVTFSKTGYKSVSVPGVVVLSEGFTNCDSLMYLDEVDLPVAGPFGKVDGSDPMYSSKVYFAFPPTAGKVGLVYYSYDVDDAAEVAIVINGIDRGTVPAGLDSGWKGPLTRVFADADISSTSENVLLFYNTLNIVTNDEPWGVKNVSASRAYVLPAVGAYGNITGGDQTHVSTVVYTFVGMVGDVPLYYEGWDIDSSTEVSVYLNNSFIGYLEVTSDNTWGSRKSILLPDAKVKDAATNVVTFKNVNNPPSNETWGVRNVTTDSID